MKIKLTFKKPVIKLPKIKLNKKEWILILIIITGIALRFYNLNFYIDSDELIISISSLKVYHDNYTDVLMYTREHPPITKTVLGLGTILTKTDYTPLKYIGSNMYVYNYLARTAVKDTYYIMRLTNAIIGVLTLLLVYLIGKNIKDKNAGLMATALCSVSFGLITYSKLIFFESFLLFTFMATIYLFIKYLKNEKWKYLALSSISLLLCLGSRNMQPLILGPALLITHVILKKWKNIKKTLIALITPYPVMFLLIYPPRIWRYAIKQFDVNVNAITLVFNTSGLISIITESLVMLVVSIITILSTILIYEKGKLYIKELKINPLLIILTVYIIFFTFTRYGNLDYRGTAIERYMVILIPLISILFTYYENKTMEKPLYYVLIALMSLNIINMILVNGVPIEWYNNNGVNVYNQLFYNNTYSKGGPIGAIQDVLNKLSDLKNPLIITNDINLLVFYNKSLVLPTTFMNTCTSTFFKNAQYIVTNDFDYLNSKYFCNEINNYNIIVYKNENFAIRKIQ